MKGTLLARWSVAVCMLTFSASLLAHHSQAVYDTTKEIVLTGTVTEFEFVNPHVLIHIEVKDNTGKIVEWITESSSPNNMRRAGWTKYTLKPGDQVTVTVNLAKNSTKEVLLKKINQNGKDIFINDRGEN